MKLIDMYGRFISGKGPVLKVNIPNNILCVKERDPKSIELERNVNSKMNQAIENALPKNLKKLPQPVNKIRIINYEEAIKELANTLKSTNNKS